MEDAPPELKPSSLQGGKWVTYGMGIGLAGVLFLGIIFGPIAIYLGVRGRSAAVASGSSSLRKMSAFVIGLGVFDILFFVIRVVGTIRLIGSGG